MKANRRKYLFRVTGHGKAATVMARTRGAAVHKFRQCVQPGHVWSLSGAVAGHPQIQLRTNEDALWDDVQIEHKNPEPMPERMDPPAPPHFIPSDSLQSKPRPELSKNLHPDTARPTPRWEWKPHSVGKHDGRCPIDYGRVKSK